MSINIAFLKKKIQITIVLEQEYVILPHNREIIRYSLG